MPTIPKDSACTPMYRFQNKSTVSEVYPNLRYGVLSCFPKERGMIHIRAKYKKKEYCRSMSPAKAGLVFAGLLDYGHCRNSQNQTAFCKIRTYSLKVSTFQYFPNLPDFCPHTSCDKNQPHSRKYTARSVLVNDRIYQGSSCGICGHLSPRCRSPPLLKF